MPGRQRAQRLSEWAALLQQPARDIPAKHYTTLLAGVPEMCGAVLTVTALTVIENAARLAENSPSLTVMVMSLYVPASSFDGVPLRVPLDASKLVQGGWLATVKLNVSPSASATVGVNAYSLPASTLLAGAPEAESGPAPRFTPRPRPGFAEQVLDEAAHALASFGTLGSALLNPSRATARAASGLSALWETVQLGARLPPPTPVNAPHGMQRRVELRAAIAFEAAEDIARRVLDLLAVEHAHQVFEDLGLEDAVALGEHAFQGLELRFDRLHRLGD